MIRNILSFRYDKPKNNHISLCKEFTTLNHIILRVIETCVIFYKPMHTYFVTRLLLYNIHINIYVGNHTQKITIQVQVLPYWYGDFLTPYE